MSVKRVVIVGAFGFIGQNLSAQCLAKGIDVLPLGRKQVDLTQAGAGQVLSEYLEAGDTVVMLSAITPDKGKTRLDFLNNIRMAMAVCEAVAAVPSSHVIYLSSDAVYSFEQSMVNESTLAAPQDLYGVMHRARELLFISCQLPLLIVRPTIIYGAGDTHNSYGPNRFMRQAMSEKIISLFGKGEEKRSHIAVQDVVTLLLKCIEHKKTGILNAATEPSYSFMEVAEKIAALMPFPVAIQTQERKSPITHRHYDTGELMQWFPAWDPIPLKEGLMHMKTLMQDIPDAT